MKNYLPTAISNPKRTNRAPSLDLPHVLGDPVPVPDAIEDDSDTAWAMWSEAAAKHEARFADTAPASMPMSARNASYAKTEPAPLAQGSIRKPFSGSPRTAEILSIDDVIVEARRNNRVCPQPEIWQQLHDMLGATASAVHGGQVQPPLTGAAWNRTPALAKRMCFRDQLEWADVHGCLQPVMTFLRGLPEEQWYHMGE
jgi:hypothetical protein